MSRATAARATTGRSKPTGDLVEDRALQVAHAGLAATFNLAVAGFLAFRRTRRLPEPDAPRLADLALLAMATFRLSRLVTKDKVTDFVRAPFCLTEGPGELPGEIDDAATGRGVRRAIGQLLTCPYCFSTWAAAGLGCGWAIAPRTTRFLASILAVDVLAEVLNMAAVASWERVEPRD